MARLYVKVPPSLFQPLGGDWIQLDLMENDPIKLTKQVTDLTDPFKAPAEYSQTFRLPASITNEEYFKSAFNINDATYDATLVAECYIMEEYVKVVEGNLRLANIFTNNQSVEYEVLIVGLTSDFASKIEGNLHELNMSAYNHDPTYVNVYNSWKYVGLFNRDIVYPLVEWGYDYLNNNPVQNTLSVDASRSFTDVSYPLSVNQLKPMARLKVIWDAIFLKAGFTYESTFLESDWFKNMYMLSENQARAYSTVYLQSQLFQDTSPTFPKDIEWRVQYDDIQVDNSALWSQIPSDLHFIGPFEKSRTTSFEAKEQLDAANNWVFRFQGNAYTPQSTAYNAIFQVRLLDSPYTVLSTNSLALPLVNNYYDFTVSFSPSVLPLGTKICSTVKFEASIVSNKNRLKSATVHQTTTNTLPATLNNFLPDNINNIDFINAIVERFRLVVTPSDTTLKHFEIEPFVDWIRLGDKVDWTHLVDNSKDIVSTPIFTDRPRISEWIDQDDTDYVNDYYQKSKKETYGKLKIDSNYPVLKDTQTYESLFSPTPLYQIGNASDIGTANQQAGMYFLIPHMSTLQGNEIQPIRPNIRILFYNGLAPSPLPWYITNDASITVQHTTHPLASNYNYFSPTTTSFDINWENEAGLWSTVQANIPTGLCSYDTFKVYWKDWYDVIMDKFGRLVTQNIVLDYTAISNLKLNDQIYIKDTWFIANNIDEYIVGQPSSTKVELYKINPKPLVDYPALHMCFERHPVDLCDPLCCAARGHALDYYFTLGAVNDGIFLDRYGNVPAPDGYYSDGTDLYFVENAEISSITQPACNCDPVLVYTFDTCYNTASACDAFCCGAGSGTMVYGDEPNFEDNMFFYSDAALTIPTALPLGWYYPIGIGATYAVQIVGGIRQQVSDISSCVC